jgi:phospholipid/cholesterol/gamma-HCH transport system substrate-binding protein
MTDPSPSPTDAPDAAGGRTVANLEFKVMLLLAFTVLLIGASAMYLLYARGAFEATQRLVLVAEDSEGVVVGMNVTFAGFPVGRVRRTELSEDGNVHILVDVPKRDAHWLRESSVFTLVRGVVGGTNIRAYSGVLTDPPLPDGAVRTVLRGDASAEIPRVISSARQLLDNLNALAASDGPLGASLANLKTTTDRLNGPGGALGVILGNEAEAAKIATALDRTNALLARLDGVAQKVDTLAAKADGMAAKADEQVFGPQGVLPDVKAAVGQVNALLADTRNSLKKMDAVLAEAQAVGANAREATNDLGTLRAEVEANLRKVESLVNEINRKWPFARDTEIKLP